MASLAKWLSFVYELSDCGFESYCSHLNFRYRACFEQGVPWDSGNYRVWIHSQKRTWHDKNIQSWTILIETPFFRYLSMYLWFVFYNIIIKIFSLESQIKKSFYLFFHFGKFCSLQICHTAFDESPADLVRFTATILNWKFYHLCSVN